MRTRVFQDFSVACSSAFSLVSYLYRPLVTLERLESKRRRGGAVWSSLTSTKAGEFKTKLKINHWRSSPGPPELAGFYVDSVWLRSIKSVPLTWSGIRASARMHTRRPAISIDMTVFINALRGLAGFSRIPTQNLPTTISFFNSLYPLGCLYQPHTTVTSMSLNFQRNEPRPRPCRNFFSSKIRTHYSMSPN